MVERLIIEQVVQEQKAELKVLRTRLFCKRKEEELVDLDSVLAQVVMGVRRSGKSVLCYNVLKQSGNLFAYANFDDERLCKLQAEDLNTMLEVLYKEYGNFTHLFLDEIQNVSAWHLFVNRLLRQGMRVVVTGSNAKLLSGELATYLTGRHAQIELFPLSFSEYCYCKGVDTESFTTKAVAFRRAAYDEYLTEGGFPELLSLRNKTRYVGNLVNGILERDIVQRFNIKNTHAFVRMAHHLMNTAPAIVVEKELGVEFGVTNMTAGNYVDHLKEAYLLVGLKKYSVKSKLRIRDEKVYPVDVALMDGRADAMVGSNLGWRMETQVFLELCRRNSPIGRDIYYYRNRGGIEADFVVCKDNKVEEIYQVSYDVSNQKTLTREIRGLLSASSDTHCDSLFLITYTERRTMQKDGKTIHVIPAHEWLLGQAFLR